MKTIGKYKNGNYITIIYDDGTKKRIAPYDTFIPDFAESMDITISEKCLNNCEMCYANCTKDGNECDFEKYPKLLDSLHPYTEIAINLNNPIHSQLEPFLRRMAEKKVIVNATINQTDFEKNIDYLKELTDKQLIWGLGVSLSNPTDEFIDKIKQFPNAVLHVIAGLFTPYDYAKLRDQDIKMLILGYKTVGRGVNCFEDHQREIEARQWWLSYMLPKIIKQFKVVSFDNNALEQLDVRRLMTDEEWEKFYMGDEMEFTFFINLVQGYFAGNSMSCNHYPIIDSMTVDDIFQIIRKEYEIN